MGATVFSSRFGRRAILVETSTISPELSRAIASDLSARNSYYLDGPISGGAHGARDGTLVAMVGGPRRLSSGRVQSFHVLPGRSFISARSAAGNVMKLVIQSIFLSQMASFLEAVSMGERSGIPLDTLLDIVAASSAHHPAIGTRYDKLRTADLDPIFEVGAAVKDLSLAESIWRALDAQLPMLASALSDYRGAAAEGFAAGRPHRDPKLAWAAKYLISATDFFADWRANALLRQTNERGRNGTRPRSSRPRP